MAPYLTGAHTLDELTSALPVAQQTTVENLVTALHVHGFVTNAQPDLPHTLTPEEEDTYAQEIAFIAYATDSAEHRFQRYRDTRILVIGSPRCDSVLSAVVASGMRSGWTDVRVAPGTERELDHIRVLAATICRDDRQRIRMVRRRDIAPLLPDTDVLLQITDSEHELAEMARACSDAGVALGQVLVGADAAWLTTVGRVADTAAESVWLRLRSARGAAGPFDEDAPSYVTGAVPALLAAQLVVGCFRHRTGLDAESSAHRATRFDLRTLNTSLHAVVPHPLASTTPRPVTTRRCIPVTPGELAERAAELIDSRTGLILRFDEDDLPQFPLSLCRAVVSDPFCVLPTSLPLPEVFGWGPDKQSAQERTLLWALAAYGGLGTAIDRGESRWGYDLASGERCEIPCPDEDALLSPVGLATGLTWESAVEWGLRQHCVRLISPRVSSGRPVNWSTAPLDETGTRLLRQLKLAQKYIDVIDLGDVLGIPAFAVPGDGSSAIVGCASSAEDALRDVLERALLSWQTGTQAWCTPPNLVAPGSERTKALIAALHQAGHSPVVLTLDHDGCAAEILPAAIHVVLRDR